MKDITNAQAKLLKGDTKEAELILLQALESGERGVELAAEAAFRLGNLALHWHIDYSSAMKYFQRAIRLHPENELYLTAKEELAKIMSPRSKEED